VGDTFAAFSSIVFAFLLLSAANTALTDLVSIQYMLSRDRELPPLFERLNRWGMPQAPLIVATLAAAAIVLILPDVGLLAGLYAIGVVGAVAINLWTTSTNRELSIRGWERWIMLAMGVFMVLVWVTIAVDKPEALVFATTIMVSGLSARWIAHHRVMVRGWIIRVIRIPAAAAAAARAPAPVLAPAVVPSTAGEGRPRAAVPTRILVPTRGNPRLIRYALEEAKARGGEVLFLFVRHVAVPTMGSFHSADPEADPEAKTLFDSIRSEAASAGVPVMCLYSVAWDVADTILEFAVTYGVDVLLLGATRRSTFWHMLKGDVTQEVTRYLPENITLLFHA
jgi:nucleotide-binding universal stress UspA family protein